MKHPTALALTARLLAETISRYERDPSLRKQSGIDLKQLADVNRIRRQLLKSAKQSNQ